MANNGVCHKLNDKYQYQVWIMNKKISYEIRTFSNGTENLDLACEITCTGGSKIYSRVKSPEGRYYIPKFKLGERIYITYRKSKWYMVDQLKDYVV